MKNILLALSLLAISSVQANANYDEGDYKKDTIKFMYNSAIKAVEYDSKSDDLDTLYAYSDRELQNAIGLIKSDSMSAYEGYEYDVSDCNEVRYILQPTTGNGYSIDEVSEVNYRLLNNGRVRASIMLDGNEDIDNSSFMDFKDYSLTCSGESCKITDVYDSDGESGKVAADNTCR